MTRKVYVYIFVAAETKNLRLITTDNQMGVYATIPQQTTDLRATPCVP